MYDKLKLIDVLAGEAKVSRDTFQKALKGIPITQYMANKIARRLDVDACLLAVKQDRRGIRKEKTR